MPEIDVLDHYLVPNPADKEVIVLSTEDLTGAIVASRTNLVALSGEAARIVHNAFLNRESTTVRAAIDPGHDAVERTSLWLRDVSADGIFIMTTEHPRTEIGAPTVVHAGSQLALTDVGENNGITLEYDGTVTNMIINGTRVIWYSAVETPPAMREIPAARFAESVSAHGSLGTSLYPKPARTNLGVNCAGCAVCAACTACAGCVLCGGLNFAVAAIGVDGTLGVIGVAAAGAFSSETRTRI